MTTYTPIQIMLTHAFIADVGTLIDESDCKAETNIGNLINQYLQALDTVKGNWQVVWGPCVFKFPLIAKYRDNTIYVAQSTKDKSQYVLALSGTNPYEITDWLFEDFLVAGMVAWEYGQRPAGAKVSLSAAISLGLLHNLKPCQGIPGAGLRLTDFLSQQAGLTSLSVAGHSLGGEMASTAALWLADTQGELWDPQKKAKVSAYCYAGPTAGNTQWVNYFHERLGDNAHRIWNSKDVAPCAWEVGTLEQVPYIYLPEIKAPIWAKPLLDVVLLSVKDKHYTQIPAVKQDKQPLMGKVNTTADWDTFVKQMAYQHVEAYHEMLKVPDLKPLTDTLRAKAKPAKLT